LPRKKRTHTLDSYDGLEAPLEIIFVAAGQYVSTCSLDLERAILCKFGHVLKVRAKTTRYIGIGKHFTTISSISFEKVSKYGPLGNLGDTSRCLWDGCKRLLLLLF
jgi:hypothetical protein